MRNNIKAVDRTLTDLVRSRMVFGGKAMLFLRNVDKFFL